MRFLLICIGSLLIFSCSKETRKEPECISFLGNPLFAKPADSLALVKSDSAIRVIREKENPTEDDFIAVSRLLISTNRFRKAIEVLSEGLEIFPLSYKLMRHRGHRYINLRQLDNAIADLSKAEELARPYPEVWEYDAENHPVATYQHQIWYHIGLYHFLTKDYKTAAADFEKSLSLAKEPKNIAGATDWLYNCYYRSDRAAKADSLLIPFTTDFNIEDKDYPYFRRLLFYKGSIGPTDLVDFNKPVAQMTLGEVTKLFGLANWLAYHGNKPQADQYYLSIVQSKEWPAFAVAAAEMELRVK